MTGHIMKSNYLKLLFLVFVLILLVISLLNYKNLNNYTNEVTSVRHSTRLLRMVEVVLSTIKDAETGHRGYQLTRDTIYLQPYYNSLKVLPGQFKLLDSLVKDNVLQTRKVDTLERLTNTQFAIIGKILANTDRSTLYMDRYESDLLLDGRGNMNEIRNVTRRIKEAEEINFRNRESTESVFRNIAPIYLLIYIVFAVAGILLLFSRVLDGLEKRKIAEDNLRENIRTLRSEVAIREFTQKTLKRVLDNSFDGIMAFRSVRDAEKIIVDFEWILANMVSLKSSGLVEKNVIGKHLLDLMPGNKTEGLFDIYKEVVETGVPRQFEKHYASENLNAWFYITVVKLEDGFVVTFSDITGQKIQRLLIEERELLLKDAENLANLGSWKWGHSNKTMVWSDGLFKILAQDRETYRPSWSSFLKNVHADDMTAMEYFFEELKIKRSGSEMEYRIELGGQIRYLSILSKPVVQDDHSSPDVLGTVLDITERKIYENQLRQYTSELKRSNEDLEQFAYIASHDLQEPLRKIRAFGDRLGAKYQEQLEGVGADYIARMQSAAARMQLLIEDLLSFSRVSRNVNAFEQLNMKELLEEVIDDLEALVKRKEATVMIHSLPNVTGERMQIKRLFQNLISNAIKFSKPDENPMLEVIGKSIKSADIFEEFGISLPQVDYVRFSVKDNGIGFDEKYLEKIFNIFQRLHGRNEFEGTGIGLSICRKIVLNHAGLITARSKENIGSDFIVILPVE